MRENAELLKDSAGMALEELSVELSAAGREIETRELRRFLNENLDRFEACRGVWRERVGDPPRSIAGPSDQVTAPRKDPERAQVLANVQACECGHDTSCYSCLRNYRNQVFHDELRRDDAIRLLAGLFADEPAEEIIDDLVDVDDRARPLLRAGLRDGRGHPTVGWETDTGEVVELAWETPRVAVIVDENEKRDRWLVENGWTVLDSDASPADLQDAMGRADIGAEAR